MENFYYGTQSFCSHNTVCAQCGYRFERGDEVSKVKQTGDLIHKGCWVDYADDNAYELTEDFEL